MFTQGRPQRVEEALPLRGETAQDQHSLRRQRVERTADALVRQQQVRELRHVEVVDVNRGLARFGDEQVLLDGIGDVHAPGGDTVDTALDQLGAGEICLHQVRAVQERARQIGALQRCPAQVCL